MIIFLILFLLPLISHAVPTTPDVAAFEASLARAQTGLDTLNTALADQRRQHADAIDGLNRAVITSLRMQQWPDGLIWAGSLTTNGPAPSTLLRLIQTQSGQLMARSETRLNDYLALHNQTRTRLDELNALRAQLANRQNRLTQTQNAALRRAVVQADVLASLLETTAGHPPSPASSQPNSQHLLPVAGLSSEAHGGGTYIHTAPDAPVQATLPGTVAFSGPFRQFGGLVIVDAGHDIFAIYAGFGTLAVNEGDTVTTGQTLGTMPATPSRLFTDIRRNGRSVAGK